MCYVIATYRVHQIKALSMSVWTIYHKAIKSFCKHCLSTIWCFYLVCSRAGGVSLRPNRPYKSTEKMHFQKYLFEILFIRYKTFFSVWHMRAKAFMQSPLSFLWLFLWFPCIRPATGILSWSTTFTYLISAPNNFKKVFQIMSSDFNNIFTNEYVVLTFD